MASRLYPADGEVRSLNQQSGDPEIPVMSWENARDKMNSSRAFRDLEVDC